MALLILLNTEFVAGVICMAMQKSILIYTLENKTTSGFNSRVLKHYPFHHLNSRANFLFFFFEPAYLGVIWMADY